MKATILKNGYLKITANNIDRIDLRNCYESGGYFEVEELIGSEIWRGNFHFVKPEDVGALTSSPIIQAKNGDVWWFPGYMIDDPWQELKNKGRVIFDPEENNKSLPGKTDFPST